MNKMDLTSKDWRDLVFDDRNKAYGGYVIRQESPRRHNIAVVVIIILAVLCIAVPALIKMVKPQDEAFKVTEVTTLSDLPEADEQKEQPKVQELPPPPPLKSSIKFTPPVIKKDNEVNDNDEIKSQEDLNQAKANISIADVKGTDDEHGVDIAEVKDVNNEVDESKPYVAVEQMPQFPGGEQKLMEFLGRNLHYPAVAQENGIMGRVIVRFVVSSTGKVTNVEVMRGVDPMLDKEAMRLISSMPDWIPGKQNGKNVPVYYTIPIIFRLQ